MTDARLSGYKAAAQTILSTELNSLADETWSALSAEFDNSLNKFMFADFEIVLASAAFTGTDSAIELYLVPSLDDTNFPNWTSGTTAEEPENQQYFIGARSTSGITEAQRMVLRDVELPAGKFKIGARSRANIGLAASGNTVKWRPYQYESA